MSARIKYEKWLLLIQAAFITFAVRLSYVQIPGKESYKTKIHYVYAMVTGWLGDYDLNGLLIFVMVTGFLLWMHGREWNKRYTGRVMPFFFAICLVLGKSYAEIQSSEFCFGNLYYFTVFLTAAAGFYFLLRNLIALFLTGYDLVQQSVWEPVILRRLLGKHCFRNVFFLLIMCWFPIILLSYPGNLCYDSIGQIEQGLGITAYTAHHPLLHTLLISGMIRFVSMVTGSNDLGLFVYILLQVVCLAAALAGTMQRLKVRQVSMALRFAVLLIYLLSPMYSNMVSTAIKDVPFMAAVVWYILLLEEFLTEGAENKSLGFWIKITVVQILVGLLRNNGIYMVVISGIGIGVYDCVKRIKKGSSSWKQPLLILCCLAILPLSGYQLTNGGLQNILHAAPGSRGEMFSIPFQQTARYLQLYQDTLPEQDRLAIENILGEVEIIAERYNPNISDPVKALYRADSGAGELMRYFKTWVTCFFRHPGVYLEAFFLHVYGWFDPAVTNSVRYEATSELFQQGGLIPGADKLLLFVYRFVAYIPVFAILENVGIYTWLLMILAGESVRRRTHKGVLLLPLFVSLLVCMASPCFYLHPRYAFPIMFTLPFLFGAVREETI